MPLHTRCRSSCLFRQASLFWVFRTAAFAALALGCGHAQPSPSHAEERVADHIGPDGRLSGLVSPQHYTLRLDIDPASVSFTGEVIIRLTAAQPLSEFFLHAASITEFNAPTISRVGAGASGTGGSGTDPRPVWLTRAEGEVLRVNLGQPLEANQLYDLRIRYTAPFDTQLKGLYRTDASGAPYVFTQFEATSARFAFPCFDEPRFKTPFETTITAPSNLQVISNTAAVVTADAEHAGWSVHRFEETRPLPTYLVAMAVGLFDIVDGGNIPPNSVRTRPLPFRGIAVRGRGQEMSYAMAQTGALLSAIEAYTGIEYPYSKLDILAVPDFASGAMENAGAITFRDQLLLLGDNPSPGQRFSFENVMAHELVHQWFGNLVTMNYWDDTWLNEGFATWLSYKIQESVIPPSNARLSQLGRTHHAMGEDSLTSVRRVRQPIESPHDIRSAFDGITYSKGAAILTMFEAFVGQDTFQRALHQYLTDHAFETAVTADLVQAVSTAHGSDLTGAFGSFLDQQGVPWIRGSLNCQDPRHPMLAVSQTPAVEGIGTRWEVPLCVRWGRELATRNCFLLTEMTQTVEAPAGTCIDGALLNADANGYYWHDIVYGETPTGVDWLAASQTVREAVSIARNARRRLSRRDSDVGRDASLLESGVGHGGGPADQRDTLLVSEFLNFGRLLLQQLPSTDASTDRSPSDRPSDRDLVVHYLMSILTPRRAGYVVNEATLVGRLAGPLDGNVRRSVLDFLVFDLKDVETRRALAPFAEASLAGTLDPDLRPAILASAVGTTVTIDRLTALLATSTDSPLRVDILVALGSVTDPAAIETVLNLSFGDNLRVNELSIAIATLTRQLSDLNPVWQWMERSAEGQTNFDRLAARMASTRVGSSPLMFASRCDEPTLHSVSRFFGPRIESYPGGIRPLETTLTSIRACVLESAETRARRVAWLSSRYALAQTAARTQSSQRTAQPTRPRPATVPPAR